VVLLLREGRGEEERERGEDREKKEGSKRGRRKGRDGQIGKEKGEKGRRSPQLKFLATPMHGWVCKQLNHLCI